MPFRSAPASCAGLRGWDLRRSTGSSRARGRRWCGRPVAGLRFCRLEEALLLVCSRAIPFRIFPRVFKTVVAGFLDADTFNARVRKHLQPAINFNTQVFGGWHFLAKSWNVIVQRFVIEFFQELLFDESVEVAKIGDHPRCRIDVSREADFNNIIVAVSVGIVAFSKNAEVLLIAQLGAVQTVGSGKPVTAAKFGFESATHQISQFPAPFAPLW